MSDVGSSYDRVVNEYVTHIYGELEHKPFDRKMLDWLIEKVGDAGTICDMGCGPGQVARYLADHGANACGIDLSGGMVERARALNPGINFQQGDMVSLTNVKDGAFGGMAAFYSILHVPRAEVGKALAEFKRVLRPNGVLLVTFHIGTETRHFDEWWGEKVNLDFHFFETSAIKGQLQAAGFSIDEAIERDPYVDVEVQTRRAYIFARNPA